MAHQTLAYKFPDAFLPPPSLTLAFSLSPLKRHTLNLPHLYLTMSSVVDDSIFVRHFSALLRP